MKRIVLLGVCALALAATGASALAAPGDDVKGPNCANIVSGTVFYDFDGTRAGGTATLAVPACKGVVYTLVVLDDEGSATPTATDEGSLNAAGGMTFATMTFAPPADGDVCLYYVSSSSGGHVFDRAPDATPSPNCVSLVPGGSAGSTGMN